MLFCQLSVLSMLYTKPMTAQKFMRDAERRLEAAEVPTARLDVLVLLEDALGVNRAHLLAHPDMEIAEDTQKLLNSQLARRAGHEPLAYVRGRTEFYGREFVVSTAVLEPRPESETMIELLKIHVSELNNSTPLTIVDVGTGSGALAITAKLEVPQADVWGVDIDPRCLQIAKRNAKMHDVKITLAKSDLLDAFRVPEGPSLVVLLCNLPYVPDSHTINTAALHEPRIAIFGGPDGLDLYRALFEQLKNLPERSLLILSESLPPQHQTLKRLASKHGYQQIDEDDFIQVFAPRS
jgi:release factor glutamine methyltransferase